MSLSHVLWVLNGQSKLYSIDTLGQDKLLVALFRGVICLKEGTNNFDCKFEKSSILRRLSMQTGLPRCKNL